MEQATPTNRGQHTVQQMFATLLREITSLRKQNEEQERRLDHLRGDMSLLLERSKITSSQKQNEEQQRQLDHLRSDMSLLLERFNIPIQKSRKLEFKKFAKLPLEIREMIWELAVPVRLLAFQGVNQGVSKKKLAPSALSVPTIAHVCQESRRVVLSRKSVTALSGRSTHLRDPSQVWRLDTKWTWFTPYKDAMLIEPLRFEPNQDYLIVQAAEHVIIDGFRLCGSHFKYGHFVDDNTVALRRLSRWVRAMVRVPEFTPLTRDPIYNLRTVDFSMTHVTRVDRNFPPNFVRRLFASKDGVRIVDLRDEEAVQGIARMLDYELSQVTDTHLYEGPWEYDFLQEALENFTAAANDLFQLVRATILHALVSSYLLTARSNIQESPAAPLPWPFKGGDLNMEVTWVKELTKRVNIRPVHVFVRRDDVSHM